MRPLLLADLDVAARVLLALPETERDGEMSDLVATAEDADRHRQATGSLLPGAGDGSLLSAALLRQRAEPGLADPLYRGCLLAVLKALDGL